MNRERIDSARRWGRLMLGIPWFALGFVMFLWVAAPASSGFSSRPDNAGVLGIPFSALPLVVGAFVFVIGYVWMWKLYRAPTRFEGARWRFHDH